MKTTALTAALALLSLTACESTESQVTLQDSRGNYITTADFEAMERVDFVAAIRAGLADFDQQLGDLRERANELGGDALRTFASCEEDLREQRTAVVNQLEIAQGALNPDWPDERSATVKAYAELREDLSEAQKDVLDR